MAPTPRLLIPRSLEPRLLDSKTVVLMLPVSSGPRGELSVVDEAETACMLERIDGADADDCSTDWAFEKDNSAPTFPEETVVKEERDAIITESPYDGGTIGYETAVAVVMEAYSRRDDVVTVVVATPLLEPFAVTSLLGPI